jgi:hypothetical protein
MDSFAAPVVLRNTSDWPGFLMFLFKVEVRTSFLETGHVLAGALQSA